MKSTDLWNSMWLERKTWHKGKLLPWNAFGHSSWLLNIVVCVGEQFIVSAFHRLQLETLYKDNIDRQQHWGQKQVHVVFIIMLHCYKKMQFLGWHSDEDLISLFLSYYHCGSPYYKHDNDASDVSDKGLISWWHLPGRATGFPGSAWGRTRGLLRAVRGHGQ